MSRMDQGHGYYITSSVPKINNQEGCAKMNPPPPTIPKSLIMITDAEIQYSSFDTLDLED